LLYNKKILTNTKSIIPPKELDIYLPDAKLAIEFDGLYWHSEGGHHTVDKNYHLHKTELCEKQNIHLIHIFENEWTYENEIIKNKLKNILKLNNNIIKSSKIAFLENINKSKIIIKLNNKSNNTIIMSCTFLKIKNKYEIINISNIEYNGFSKILKYFIKNYNPNAIIFKADRRWFTVKNNIFKKYGFKLIKVEKPKYYYFKNSKKEFCIENKNKWSYLKSQGYFRIYDCGNLIYKYTQH